MNVWRNCSACKQPIEFGRRYWTCNVSTCNQKKTSFVFCTVACWDSHVPIYNHRDSWADEQIAPASALETQASQATSIQKNALKKGNLMGSEILVVASKLKAYIKEKSGMSTSANVMPKLSEQISALCDQAIENAKRDGRKTVMDRDFV